MPASAVWAEAKDPSDVLDYYAAFDLDSGDAISTHVATVTAGVVTIASSALADTQTVRLWLSDGIVGDVDITMTVVTSAGRTLQRTWRLHIEER
jgi:hypothetical protein